MTSHDDIEQHCQEIRALMQLRSDNNGDGDGHTGSGSTSRATQHILQLHDYFYNWKTHQLDIVTELLGMNFQDWLAQQDIFLERQAREVARVLLDALAFMHGKGVVHRDVKEENVVFGVSFNTRFCCTVVQISLLEQFVSLYMIGFVADRLITIYKV